MGDRIEPNDLPVETRHLDMYRTFATELDKTWQGLGFGATVVEDALDVLGIVRGVDRETLVREPSAMTVINTNSPLRLDGPMGDGLIQMARFGQPVVATPFTLAGAMSVGLAGRRDRPAERRGPVPRGARADRPPGRADGLRRVHLERGHADRRAGVRHARVRQGRHRQRSDGPTLRAAVAVVQCDGVQRRGRPGGLRVRDGRVGRIMGGVNLLYQGAGWLEGGLTASYEKLIIDAEILQMMSEVLQPLEVSDATLGFEALADVGPGGHFFGSAHTLERYETAFYRPIVSDWRNFETWEADGARTATERANAIWKRLLAEAVPPPLDPGRAEALDEFVARRKREIVAAG